MSVLLAHPGAGPFVEQSVRGLIQADLLECFATALALQPSAISTRLLLKIPFGVGRALSARVVHNVPAKFLRLNPYGEIRRALAHRMDPSGLKADRAWDANMHNFSAWAGRQISASTRLVYGYDYGALELFQAAQPRGVKRVLEHPAAAYGFNSQLLEDEAREFPALRSAYRANAVAKRSERSARRDAELEMASAVICNSTFTRATFARAGFDVSRFRIVPLGSPPIEPSRICIERDTSQPLRILFAGNFSALKGAYYLLSALNSLPNPAHLEVHCYGAMGLPADLTSNVPTSLKFLGSVPREELRVAMHHADALILPSLSDGFGMVVTEALAAALPVICTSSVGAADLIQDRRNGLVIEPRSAASIQAALSWCLDHRLELNSMRARAVATASAWQWSDYRRAHSQAIAELLAA